MGWFLAYHVHVNGKCMSTVQTSIAQ